MEPSFRLMRMPGMLKCMTEYFYRVATQDDIQAITDIYNAAVIRGGSIVGFLGYVIAFILSVWIVFDIYFKGRSNKKR